MDSEHTLTIEGSTIYYSTVGDPKNPVMLFLHGWPGIGLVKSDFVKEFKKYFYMIVPEQPGLIRSDPLPSYINIFKQNAEVAHEILKNENLHNQKIVVMGQSFGGAVAATFAEMYPKNVRVLILVDSLMGAGRSNWWMKLMFSYNSKLDFIALNLPDFLQRLGLKLALAINSQTQAEKSRVKRTLKQRLEMISNYTNLVRKSVSTGKNLIDKNYGKFPILFIWGDRDGKEFNLYGSCNVDDARDLSKSLADRGQDIKFVEVKGGHTILYDNPHYVLGEMFKNL